MKSPIVNIRLCSNKKISFLPNQEPVLRKQSIVLQSSLLYALLGTYTECLDGKLAEDYMTDLYKPWNLSLDA